jgi:cardiolipin synthase
MGSSQRAGAADGTIGSLAGYRGAHVAKKRQVDWVENVGGTHYIRTPLVLFFALTFAVALMTIVLWSIWRENTTYLRVKDPGDLNALLPSIVGLTESSIDPGNRVELLENGDGFFPRLFGDIAAARQTIHIESFIWGDGRICEQLASALEAKARQGVEVRLLVDASGGHRMKKELDEQMRQAGVRVVKFHKITLGNIGRLNNRDHRKLAIIDGRTGYIGGYGFDDEWTGHAQDKKHYRDSGLRVEGPLVNRMQGAFSENWIEETGEVPAGEKYFPHLAPVGPTAAHIAYTSPSGSVSSVQVLYYLAIKAARHEIIIQNPYLLPDRNAIDALADAVHRGVDVKVMVPATTSTDSPVVQHASHHHFGTLLRRGVKVYEYKRTLLHQKTIVVDGVWSCIGSTNFDDRSFQLNDEVSVAVLDRNIAQQLRAAFADDLRDAEQRHFDEWSHRSLWHKMIDGLAYLAHSQL